MPHPDPAMATTRCTERLEEILAEELAVCKALIEAGRMAHRAFAEAEPQAVMATVSLRREQLDRLEALEGEAGTLRARFSAPPEVLLSHTARLRDLTQEIAAEEAELRRLSTAAVGQLREKLKGFQAGSTGLRGYRGSVTVAPRFSDRRG